MKHTKSEDVMARKTKNATKNATMVTEFSDFYRSMGPEGMRYYAATGSNRTAAIEYHNGMPDNVKGFAVYDTTISSDYAVALYADKESAELHTPSEPPHAPEEAVEEDEEIEYDDLDVGDDDEEIEDFDDPLDGDTLRF
jgi:hypothetical protein